MVIDLNKDDAFIASRVAGTNRFLILFQDRQGNRWGTKLSEAYVCALIEELQRFLREIHPEKAEEKKDGEV